MCRVVHTCLYGPWRLGDSNGPRLGNTSDTNPKDFTVEGRRAGGTGSEWAVLTSNRGPGTEPDQRLRTFARGGGRGLGSSDRRLTSQARAAL